ncbi:helix-turn-helix domain-containing protein [Streptomyces sp. NRRL F-5527]|uniref:helix-turn-helix domain-containing protein n=1 Tax=Streptomyces sp. NRRL F-5527 TaxID=1463862 RepID=UPI000690260D|nr:helix-turn-helix domain-containing protein [Streptomyces sp. NRRL F-5527]
MPDRPTPPPQPETPLPKIKRRRHLTGEEAATFSKQVVDAYARMSIRAICEETGRSYGAIHRVLHGAGVTFRPRGYQHPPALGNPHGEK